MDTLAKRLVHARTKAGLTQPQMAARSGLTFRLASLPLLSHPTLQPPTGGFFTPGVGALKIFSHRIFFNA